MEWATVESGKSSGKTAGKKGTASAKRVKKNLPAIGKVKVGMGEECNIRVPKGCGFVLIQFDPREGVASATGKSKILARTAITYDARGRRRNMAFLPMKDGKHAIGLEATLLVCKARKVKGKKVAVDDDEEE